MRFVFVCGQPGKTIPERESNRWSKTMEQKPFWKFEAGIAYWFWILIGLGIFLYYLFSSDLKPFCNGGDGMVPDQDHLQLHWQIKVMESQLPVA